LLLLDKNYFGKGSGDVFQVRDIRFSSEYSAMERQDIDEWRSTLSDYRRPPENDPYKPLVGIKSIKVKSVKETDLPFITPKTKDIYKSREYSVVFSSAEDKLGEVKTEERHWHYLLIKKDKDSPWQVEDWGI
jgi:hypothetical protein